ncbi:calpain-A [Trichonephila inaurata madagascariensis]|uniref:Calpain-A n=1 Tax=Trichonephila inaurata madagascariensis TaxID=2747483 RepID=A0A8X7C5D7_9ARAC|nr:calpain-A [Trichonephila inaurata madagascariensis]
MGSGCSRATKTSAVGPVAAAPVDPLEASDMVAGKDRRVSIRDPLVGHQRMGGDKSPPPNLPGQLPPRATKRDVDRVKGSRPPSPMNYEQRWGEREEDVEEEAFDISDISDDSDEITFQDDANVLRSLALLRVGQLFMDANFPPVESSLYYSHRLVEGKVTWMRPHEMIPEPKLLIDNISRHDIVQGVLADCWFLSSCAAVAQRPDLMRRVIAPYQPLYGMGYRGIIRFRFWRFGKWINVYVDDLLPTREGELLFSRCSDRREFWVALLEKAYAKLHGSYEALEGDLTEMCKKIATHTDKFASETSNPSNLTLLLRKGGDWQMANAADPNGLVSGHAYTVTAVAKVPMKEGNKVNLVRIRNPWGNDVEWNGSWNDNDSRWSEVDLHTKHELEWRRRDDGEFWMEYKDFCREFEEVTICTLGPDFDGDGVAEEAGMVKAIRGKWEVPKTSGGSRNNLELFARNPQYLLSVYEHEIKRDQRKESVGSVGSRYCCAVIALMQVRRRCMKHPGRKMMQVGFVVYRTEDPKRRLSVQDFVTNEEEGNSGPYINYREVFARFELAPGHYVIIPATFEPHRQGSFMIRVYTDCPFDLRELR